MWRDQCEGLMRWVMQYECDGAMLSYDKHFIRSVNMNDEKV